MSFGTGILLALIGYFVLKAVLRLYRAMDADRPKQSRVSDQKFYLDKFGRKHDIEDTRWRDLPSG